MRRGLADRGVERVADRQGYLGIGQIERDAAQCLDGPRRGDRLVEAELREHPGSPIEQPLAALCVGAGVGVGVLLESWRRDLQMYDVVVFVVGH